MDYNIQTIVDLYSSFMLIGFPIGIVMLIAEKLTLWFQDFILGKNVRL